MALRLILIFENNRGMRFIKVFILLFILLQLFSSCKKEKRYEIIYPLSYFPVYPGSWWKYVDSNNDTIIIRTDHSYQEDYDVDFTNTSETYLVPVYDGTPIWGYEAHVGSGGSTYYRHFQKIISETDPIGTTWAIASRDNTRWIRKISAKDTTIIINDVSYYPTIVVDQFWGEYYNENILTHRRYYTKDIGLIREDNHETSDSTVNTMQIIDYYILN